MIVRNKLGKSFKTGGASMGTSLLIAGAAICYYYSLVGLVFIMLGVFMAFTTEITIIDADKMRIKSVSNLFGIIPFGKWIDIEQDMKLRLKKSKKGYRTHTRGHSRDFYSKEIRIMLHDKNYKEILSIEKFPNLKAAKEGLENLYELLNSEIIIDS